MRGYRVDKDGILVSTMPWKWWVFTVVLVILMGRVAFCSDHYKLTTVLIEAPAAANLSIDGRPLKWCKDEYNTGGVCNPNIHDGVRVYQWLLRTEMTASVQVTLDANQERFEIIGEDPDLLIGYQVLEESGGLVIAEIEPSALK